MTTSNAILETARLIVRPATVEDVELYDLWTNPQVMQYVGFPNCYIYHITRENWQRRQSEVQT